MTAALRQATPADAAAIIALWEACALTRPWNDPDADLARAFAWPGAAVLVVEDAGDLIATVMTGYDGHRGWLYYLGVHPERRGEGLARLLVAEACVFLEGLGCPKAELMVRGGNPAAGLYPRLGWEPQDVAVWARWLAPGKPG
ncbi:MAG: GNAT family acetyltransferase [Erythrobacter sp.]